MPESSYSEWPVGLRKRREASWVASSQGRGKQDGHVKAKGGAQRWRNGTVVHFSSWLLTASLVEVSRDMIREDRA